MQCPCLWSSNRTDDRTVIAQDRDEGLTEVHALTAAMAKSMVLTFYSRFSTL